MSIYLKSPTHFWFTCPGGEIPFLSRSGSSTACVSALVRLRLGLRTRPYKPWPAINASTVFSETAKAVAA